MIKRGQEKFLNKSILIQDSFLGIEKPLAIFIILVGIIVWKKSGFISISFCIYLVFLGVGFALGKFLYAKDPFIIRHTLLGFLRFEIKDKYLFSRPTQDKALKLNKKSPFIKVK